MLCSVSSGGGRGAPAIFLLGDEMSVRLKYIIFKHDGGEVPVVFPADIMHKMMMVCGNMGGRSWPVSAGFCEMDSDGVCCFGKSDSLELESRPLADANAIHEYYKPQKEE
jgi:hypothetical protein